MWNDASCAFHVEEKRNFDFTSIAFAHDDDSLTNVSTVLIVADSTISTISQRTPNLSECSFRRLILVGGCTLPVVIFSTSLFSNLLIVAVHLLLTSPYISFSMTLMHSNWWTPPFNQSRWTISMLLHINVKGLHNVVLAASILYDNVGAMDKCLPQLCCFLLIDICLRLHEVPFAVTVLLHADKLPSHFSKPHIQLPKLKY